MPTSVNPNPLVLTDPISAPEISLYIRNQTK